MSQPTDDDLAALANWYRARSIQMADAAGSGHPTSSMSATDLVAVLMGRHLRLDVDRPDAPGNDRLLFSKGHASPLLYAALDSAGLFAQLFDEMERGGELDGDGDPLAACYRRRHSIFEGHPTPRIPGVPAATGSLGLGPPIGIGLAIGNRLLGCATGADGPHVWLVCGDGELAEGSVWEAAEHAGSTPVAGLTIVVDVNRLGQTGPTRHGWDLEAYRARFDGFGWRTLTIDGHDVAAIDDALRRARASERPTAVIAKTSKGHGVDETEDELGKHGKPLDDPAAALAQLGNPDPIRVAPARPVLDDAPAGAGAPHPEGSDDGPRWQIGDEVPTRDAFGAAIAALGGRRTDIVGLDGEVKDSTRFAQFADEFPERFVEAFIAEQLMVGAAIGLDAAGWRPVVATFGAFLTRAHDVVRMATISRAQLLVVGSHAGVSIGEDGPSQMALEDLAMFRALAGSTVVSPSDANQTAGLLDELVDRPGVSYLRTMRGATPVLYRPGQAFPVGGSVVVHDHADPDVAIIATGVTVHEALEAADRLEGSGVGVRVVDAYSIKPLDEVTVLAAARAAGRVLVVEDHHCEGGLGDAVAAVLGRHGVGTPMLHLAVDVMPGSATPEEQRAEAGIDANGIVAALVG